MRHGTGNASDMNLIGHLLPNEKGGDAMSTLVAIG
jgi:hypothetical protein